MRTTGVAVFDLLEMRAKTGIAHRALRPVMGLVDPDNARTLPRMVAACSGFDVLCHGLESFTAMPFGDREAAESPGLRPSYQGSNPISDVWSTKAIEMVSQNMARAIHDPDDHEARSQMTLAATVRRGRLRGTRVSTCHTACRTPSRAWCATLFPTTTRQDMPSSLTGCR